MTKIYNEKKELIEIRKDGKVTERFRPLDGEKISKETREKLKKEASSEFEKTVFEILTGETLNEFNKGEA